MARLLGTLALTTGVAVSQGIPSNVLLVRELTPPPTTPDGLTWATAFQNPQDALVAVGAPGSTRNEIWVAEGTYAPTSTSDRTVSFVLVPGTRLYGGFLGTESNLQDRPTPLATTTLTGDIDNSPFTVTADSFHVVRVDEPGLYFIEGFTIERGAAIPASGNPVAGDPNNWGGGLLAYLPGASEDITELEIRDVTFRNCLAGGGGGLAAGGSGVDFVRVSRCVFENNIGFSRDPDVDVGHLGVGGGALFWNIGGTDLLRFQGDEGTGLQSVIEGVYIYHSRFSGNTSTYGGGICVANARENIWLVNNLLHRNSACGGGGLFEYHGSGSIGGVPAGWPRVEFCTFSSNSALDNLGPAGSLWSGGGAIHTQWGVGGTLPNPSIVVRSSILWGNFDQTPATNDAASIGGAAAVAALVDSSDVQRTTSSLPWPGPDNINQDPLFVNAVGGNLRLSFGSPCIDGAEDLVLDRVIGLGDFADVDRNGVFGGTNGQHLPVDLDLTPARESLFLLVPPLTLAIPTVRADMGCYEYVLGNPGAQ